MFATMRQQKKYIVYGILKLIIVNYINPSSIVGAAHFNFSDIKIRT